MREVVGTMPLYEYECPKCNEHFDVSHGVNEKRRPRCPKCRSTSRRVFLPVGIIFKGSGFHVTDYGRGNSPSNGNGKKKAEKIGEKIKETETVSSSSSSWKDSD
jgi:putative FmdB family regulatory protein